MKLDALVWAKDDSGYRHLCSMSNLKDSNFVSSEELSGCIDSDERLDTRQFVPSNEPLGRLRFPKSFSLN